MVIQRTQKTQSRINDNSKIKRMLFTSESVCEGHPDKVCDQISDAVLDECLRQDPESRVAAEAAIKNGIVWVFGEISTKGYVDIDKIVRNKLKTIGYTNTEFGIDYENCGVMSSIVPQSKDISAGVTQNKNRNKEQGAGDQGMMFGYACNETREFMPLPITLAHNLTNRLSEVRKKGIIPYLGPDGKSQVTVEYANNRPLRIHTIVISNQHLKSAKNDRIRKDIIKNVIIPVCGKMMDKKTIVHINPSGRFEIGGPAADSGLTGRKIIVDTYGGMGRHGGGAFSGKDPSKVDRSAAYACRYIAKNIVAAGLAERFEVQLSYAIGIAEPVSIYIDSFGTGKVSDEKIKGIIRKVFPLKPADMIKHLDLKKPIYARTAVGGHFGNPDFRWEKIDKVNEIRRLC